MPRPPLDGRVAVVSGANHGIGAATAAELARLGGDVAITYLAYTPTDHDPGRPDEYRVQREQGARATVTAVEAAGRRAHAVEADLRDANTPARVFDEAESGLGPVSILVNNASGWRKDTFSPDRHDPLHRHHETVSGDTALPQPRRRWARSGPTNSRPGVNRSRTGRQVRLGANSLSSDAPRHATARRCRSAKRELIGEPTNRPAGEFRSRC